MVGVQEAADYLDRRQAEREQAGPAYTHSGRIFTDPDGRPLRPDHVTQRFHLLLAQYASYRRRAFVEGWDADHIARRHRTAPELVRIALEGPPLPPIRLHDLRHGSATSLHADVYAVVAEELAEDAAVSLRTSCAHGQREVVARQGGRRAVRIVFGGVCGPCVPGRVHGSAACARWHLA